MDPKLLFPTGSDTSSWQSWHIYSLLAHSSCLASCTALSLIETNMITETSLGYIWLFGCCFRNEDFYSPNRTGAVFRVEKRSANPSLWLSKHQGNPFLCPLQALTLAVQTGSQVCTWKAEQAICCIAHVLISPQPFCCLYALVFLLADTQSSASDFDTRMLLSRRIRRAGCLAAAAFSTSKIDSYLLCGVARRRWTVIITAYSSNNNL